MSKSQPVRFKSSVCVYLIGQLPLYSRNTPAIKKYAGENAFIFAKKGVQLACVQTPSPLQKKSSLSPFFSKGRGASVKRLVLNTQKKKLSNYEGIIDSYLQVLSNSNKNRLNLDLSLLAEHSSTNRWKI